MPIKAAATGSGLISPTSSQFAESAYLDAPELGAFFQYEAYAAQGLYHLRRGEGAASERYFARAEAVLPPSPIIEPWKRTLEARRAELVLQRKTGQP